MTDDLVEQLLKHLRFGGGAGVQVRASSCLPLADAIEALTAERDRLLVSNMQMLGDIAVAMGRIEALIAKLTDAIEGLQKCQTELDEYSRQEYSLDHTVHERYRQRDYDANLARITLAALKGETP